MCSSHIQTHNDVLPRPDCAVSKDLPGGKLMDASAHPCHNPAATTNPQPLHWAGPAGWFSSCLSFLPSHDPQSSVWAALGRKVKRRGTACFLSVVSNLSLVRYVPSNLKCKEDVNQDRKVLKGCWVEVCSHDQRAHIYRGNAVVVWY